MLLLIIVHQYTHCMYICISNQCVRRGLRKLLRLAQTEIIWPTIGTKSYWYCDFENSKPHSYTFCFYHVITCHLLNTRSCAWYKCAYLSKSSSRIGKPLSAKMTSPGFIRSRKDDSRPICLSDIRPP